MITWSCADGVPLPAAAVSASGLELRLPPSELPRGGAALSVVTNLTVNGDFGQPSLTVPSTRRRTAAPR